MAAMAAMAIRFLLCTLMAVSAFRSKTPEEALNLDDFAPLCDEEIVNDTCRLLNEGDKHQAVEQFTTWQEIAEHLSAEPGFLDKFKDRMGSAAIDGKVWIECKPLCKTIVDLIKETAVLPPKSDIACYTVMDETFCDLDVRPSVLKSVGPKSDSDLPDFGDDLFLKTSGQLVEQEHSAVEVATEPGMPMDSDTPLAAGVTYAQWEALERLANLFRIYPDLGARARADLTEDGGSNSLLQRSFRSQNRMRGMTPDQARLNSQKEEMAKAYLGLVIRAFSAKETQDHMKKWFGRDAFYNKMARKEVLRVMNSVDHMISNVHYVFPGKMCTDRTFAYVYPKGGACKESQLEKYACRTLSDTKQFIFYLCPFYFTRPAEMVETLVHEGSHHATAYTEDVEFQGAKAYGRRSCKELARKEPLQALKNADSFCYYIQDAAEAALDRPGEQVSGKCPRFAREKKPDNDGDCQCPKGTQCYFGGRFGCPFSASPRRNTHSADYFNAECLQCSCEGAVTTTTGMRSWDGNGFGWDGWDSSTKSEPKGEPKESEPENEPESEPEGNLKCPEHSALPIADSQGDCYCSGGRHCFMWGEKGCTYSGTNSKQRFSPLYFAASCSECRCMLDG